MGAVRNFECSKNKQLLFCVHSLRNATQVLRGSPKFLLAPIFYVEFHCARAVPTADSWALLKGNHFPALLTKIGTPTPPEYLSPMQARTLANFEGP